MVKLSGASELQHFREEAIWALAGFHAVLYPGRLDYQPLFGRGAPLFGEEQHERAAEIEPSTLVELEFWDVGFYGGRKTLGARQQATKTQPIYGNGSESNPGPIGGSAIPASYPLRYAPSQGPSQSSLRVLRAYEHSLVAEVKWVYWGLASLIAGTAVFDLFSNKDV